jgi:hypothetical protein
MPVFAVLLAMIILLGQTVSASAAFYRYYDESGGVNVTNDYKSIPERYRANVSTVTESALANKAKARERREQAEHNRAERSHGSRLQQVAPAQNAAPEPTAISAAPQQEVAAAPDKSNGSWLSRQLPLLKVCGIIVLLITAFVYANKAVSALAPHSLAIVIRIAMFAALAVYLVKGLSGQVADAFARIQEESKVAQKAVDKRSEKIQQQAE